MEKQNLLQFLQKFVVSRFNLRHDQANEQEVIGSITRNSDFVGANLWTLIFAILIASIGLNMNSTAVIIGAMLISPLMGPIMGVGLGIGTNNFELVKKGGRNLITATLIGIATSAIYFWITPLDEAKSELLSRTTPTLWDVFIAFFGGLAGVVAATRNEKSNAIPGVAIATALMPPLCTAGYGLATGHFYYFLGALYLYLINSIFICISTFMIIRLMKFKRVSFDDPTNEKKVSRYILGVIIITVLPSIYLTYGIVHQSIFESSAKKFVKDQFTFKNTMVISTAVNYNTKTPEIDVSLIGKELPQTVIDSIESNLKRYQLDEAKLIVRQGFNARKEIDPSKIKTGILEELLQRDSLHTQQLKKSTEFPDIRNELKALYPTLKSYSLGNAVVRVTDGSKQDDTLTLVVLKFSTPLRRTERAKLTNWLTGRLQADSIKLVLE